MIEKLYSIKKMQLDQKLAKKQQLVISSIECEEEIQSLHQNLAQTGVKMFGSIADFKVLAIHKNTMKEEIKKLVQRKSLIDKDIIKIDMELVEYNKEIEQYKYIMEKENLEYRRKLQKHEELVASEFVQSKWAVR